MRVLHRGTVRRAEIGARVKGRDKASHADVEVAQNLGMNPFNGFILVAWTTKPANGGKLVVQMPACVTGIFLCQDLFIG